MGQASSKAENADFKQKQGKPLALSICGQITEYLLKYIKTQNVNQF